MIIELFGPPGSGKSTFSHRMAADLDAAGHPVKLVLSQRPAEGGGLLGRRAAPLRRLLRPARQLLRAALTGRIGFGIVLAFRLLTLFPQRSWFRSLRIGQYLVRLDHSWRRAQRSPRVTIFDQAYIQTVYSLADRAGVVDPDVIARALALLPGPDLVVAVEASPEVLKKRLEIRLACQGPLERLFELDAHSFSGGVRLQEVIKSRLGACRHELLTVEGTDEGAVSAALRRALSAVRSRAATMPARPLARAPRQRIASWIAAGLAIGLAPLAVILVPLALNARDDADPGPSLDAASASVTPAAGRRVLHYAAQANFDRAGRYTPAEVGFNLADVGTPAQLKGLPDGVKALVWVGLCEGVTPAFTARVTPFLGQSRVWGFYLMDDPDPRGLWHTRCAPEHLAAEADWIKARSPASRTFVALMNEGTLATPSYAGGYTMANSHVDLFGIAPYPCVGQGKSCDLATVDRFVAAADAVGIDRDAIVPIFQTFGGGEWSTDGGERYAMPSPADAIGLLDRWNALVPHPAFDYAYSWGAQRGDQSLAGDPGLREVFARHNAGIENRRAGAGGLKTLARDEAASEGSLP